MESKQYFWHFLTMSLYLDLIFISLYILIKLDRFSTKIPVFDLVIMSFAVFRLTRLFTNDIITDFIRDYFNKFEKGLFKSASQLINCPWCTGIWMAFIVGFFYFLTPFAFYIIFLIALAGIGSLIYSVVRIM